MKTAIALVGLSLALEGALFLTLALRRVYGGGWLGALVKGSILGIALSVSLGLGLAAAAVTAFLVF